MNNEEKLIELLNSHLTDVVRELREIKIRVDKLQRGNKNA